MVMLVNIVPYLTEPLVARLAPNDWQISQW